MLDITKLNLFHSPITVDKPFQYAITIPALPSSWHISATWQPIHQHSHRFLELFNVLRPLKSLYCPPIV